MAKISTARYCRNNEAGVFFNVAKVLTIIASVLDG